MNKKTICFLAVLLFLGLFFSAAKTEDLYITDPVSSVYGGDSQIKKAASVAVIPEAVLSNRSISLQKTNLINKSVRTRVRIVLALFWASLFQLVFRKTGSSLRAFLTVCTTFLKFSILQIHILHKKDGKKGAFCHLL